MFNVTLRIDERLQKLLINRPSITARNSTRYLKAARYDVVFATSSSKSKKEEMNSNYTAYYNFFLKFVSECV